MNKQTLFSAYKEACHRKHRAATNRLRGIQGIAVNKDSLAREWQRYNRLAKKLEGRIMEALGQLDELAADGWTHITDDPATLPPYSFDGNGRMTWYCAAWTHGDERRTKRSLYRHSGWADYGGGADLGKRGWHVYAWRPWPKPPPRASK